MLKQIRGELQRLEAILVRVSLDRQFEPEAGELLKVNLGSADWHLPPTDFLALLRELSAGAGDEAVKEAIEKKGVHVWHGPAPRDSRDTSHSP